jgi:hypothetical protein
MSTNTTRQPAGIPAGGQFAATAHAEPEVSLAPAAATGYDPERQARVRQAISARTEAMRQAAAELELLQLDGAIGCALRDFPEATELRLNYEHSQAGILLEGMKPVSLRDRDGRELTGGTLGGFAYRQSNTEPGPTLANHVRSISHGFFNAKRPGVGFDFTTGETTVDLTRTYSPEGQP